MSATSNARGLSPALLFIIVEAIDHPADLANFARACKLFSKIAQPKLYRRIVVTRRNAARLFYGLPRKAAPKRVTLTKPEWNQQLELFSTKFREIIDEPFEEEEDEAEEAENYPDWMYDSAPETDDELAPPVNANPQGDPTRWGATKDRLALCRHLTFLQIPPRALLFDIMTETEDSGSESGGDGWETTYKSLFPNVTHLAFSPRAVRDMTEPEYFSDVSEGDESCYYFAFLLGGGAFGVPRHVCITCPPESRNSTDESLFRFMRMSVHDMTKGKVNGMKVSRRQVHKELRYARPVIVVNRLPPGAGKGSITVHGILYPDAYDVHVVRGPSWQDFALPLLGRGSEASRYRYFYAPKSDFERLEVAPVALRKRINALEQVLKAAEKGSTFEHIGVGRNLCETGDEVLDETAAIERIKALAASEDVAYTDAADAQPCEVCAWRDEGVKMGLEDLREWAGLGRRSVPTDGEGA